MRSKVSRRAIVLAAALIASGSGDAFAWDGSKAYEACIGKAGGNDPAMAECGQDEFVRQDKALNTTYAASLKKADSKLKAAIQKAQKLWLAARDPTCDAESLAFEGGTLENVTYVQCQARMTIERVQWLKQFAEDR